MREKRCNWLYIQVYYCQDLSRHRLDAVLKRGVTMATRRLVSRARRDRKHENRSEEAAYGAPVPEGLHEAIEEERGNLSKAESVLGCLAIAMESEADSVDGPYYPE